MDAKPNNKSPAEEQLKYACRSEDGLASKLRKTFSLDNRQKPYRCLSCGKLRSRRYRESHRSKQEPGICSRSECAIFKEQDTLQRTIVEIHHYYHNVQTPPYEYAKPTVERVELPADPQVTLQPREISDLPPYINFSRKPVTSLPP